jgi:large conductance mechanosensitive channel
MAVSDAVKGFREFILRGNVVDLAVAVVIGTAFTAVVTSFTKNIINQVLAALGGKPDFNDTLIWKVNGASIKFGAFLGDVINFVILAAIVYFFVVVPVNALQKRRAKGEIEEETPEPQVQLLTEIRDLLAKR